MNDDLFSMTLLDAPSTSPPGLDVPVNRQAYVERCRMRWERPYLQDAFTNFRHFEKIRPQLMQALLAAYPDHCGGLASFLWTLQEKIQPDNSRLDPLLDFCNGTQKVHLRRGLVFYCEDLLKIAENARA
jgi:hypothetical protein